MKIYIAGPITGDPNYREKFAKAADEISARGNIPMNPAILPQGFDWNEYMKICFAMIDVCDAVKFLKGWKDSTGANREFWYAQAMGKMLIDINE